MPDPAILAIEGSQPKSQVRFVPIAIQKFFSGLWTQRSPFNGPDNRYNTRYLGTRADMMVDGSNVELTNYGTIIRRPGNVPYSTAHLSSPGLAFYSFHDLTGTIRLMADTVNDVSVLTPTTNTVIFNKSNGSGQTDFIGVGNTLFFGDGVDLEAWNPSISPNTRGWGISIGSVANTVTQTATVGANGPTPPTNPWINPNNVSSTANYATVHLVSGDLPVFSQYLQASTFGFGLSASEAINGITVTMDAFINPGYTVVSSNPVTTPYIQVFLLKNGAIIGSSKTQSISTVSTGLTFGDSGDLWGATWTPNDINQTGFGVAVQVGFSPFGGNGTFNVRNVKISISGIGGPSIAVQTGNGSLFTVNGGWQYVFAYGNSNSGHISNPTVSSASTGNFGGTGFVSTSGTGVTLITGTPFNTAWAGRTISIAGVNYTISTVNSSTTLTLGSSAGTQAYSSFTVGYASVQVTLTASTDPQVNQIHVYRTKDGGSVYFELPNSPFPNTSGNVSDTSTDSGLQLELFWPTVPTNSNTPPPTGLVHYVYHLRRIWGVVGNYVYYSAGPDVTLGSGNESFPPANNFLFPSQVVRLVPISSGLLVFTIDDIFIILGTNLATFYAMPYQQGVGLIGYNALDIQGSNIFLYTSDRQFLQLSPAGFNEIGYAIGDLLQQQFDPNTDIHVVSLVQGTSDKAVFIADGNGIWYRCNWNQPPEGGPAWSPRANIVGGFTHVQSVETAPGLHQLLMCQNLASGGAIVLARDLNTFIDNGTPYSAFLTLGSIVVAQPGQIGEIQSVTTELRNVGQQPSVSVLIEEISGVFESLPNGVPDPPQLVPSNSVLSQRFYLTQSQQTIECRHLQLRLDFAAEAVKNELLTVSLFGALKYHE